MRGSSPPAHDRVHVVLDDGQMRVRAWRGRHVRGRYLEWRLASATDALTCSMSPSSRSQSARSAASTAERSARRDSSVPAGADREFFEKHLARWIRRFFVDLENVKSADFYARVGALGRTFIDVETEAFALPA